MQLVHARFYWHVSRLWRSPRMLKVISAFAYVLVLIPFLATACGDNMPSPNPFFPVQSKPETVYPAGDSSGKLVLENDYLLLKPFIGDSYLLIWPYGYSIEITGKEVQILDDGGEVVATVGERIRVGGGEISAEIAEKYIGQPLPDSCPDSFWLVSGVIND